MADTTEGDTDVLYLGVLVLALMALIAGLVIHSFIIGVNVSDWWRGRSVTPVDLIVTSLGISRIGAQSVVTVYLFLVTVFFSSLDSALPLFFLDALYDFFVFTNFWLTSLLSIVLCLKISNLHTRLFLYLRKMISHRTGRLIVASVIFSGLYSSITLLMAITNNTGNSGTYNVTTNDTFTNCVNNNSMYIITIGSFIPMISYFTSSVLLFVSLYHHTTRMKMSSNLSINLETYYSAMRLVSFTFLYNILYFVGHFFCVFYYFYYCVGTLWLYFAVGFLPALHSSYLIYKTAKLRNQMSKVLQ
ncbi:hypothetical protein GDO81_023420, partial [Engystomops pustulosus]